MSKREAKESPITIGTNEVKALLWNVPTSWSSNVTSPSTTIELEDTGEDKSDTNLTGSDSVSGQQVTTKLVTGLQLGESYILRTQFTDGAETLEMWTRIEVDL